MATQQINFSQIKTVKKNSIDIDKIMLNGVRRWERYLVPTVTQVWVTSGYESSSTEDSGWKYRFWSHGATYAYVNYTSRGYWYIAWNNSTLASRISSTSHSVGGYTYYRGSYVGAADGGRWYRIKRTRVVTTWVDTSHYEDVTNDVVTYFY